MIVFKNYFKILNKNKPVIIMYMTILLVFTIFAVTSGSTTSQFTASKPNIAIINNDEDSEVTNNLVDYLKQNATIVSIKDDDNSINDALFYQDVSAVIYIYNGYTNDFLNNKDQTLDIKLGTSASSSYAELLINKYLKVADIANDNLSDSKTILSVINDSLNTSVNVKISSTLDTTSMEKAAYYYNFANYSILAICIYIIATLMSTFNTPIIKKRNIVSSKKMSSIVKELYLGNCVFTFFLWAIVVLISFIVLKDVMLTKNGLLLIVNSFLFTLSALGIGFFIGNILKSRNAINGVMNIIALGSSFLCGAFVPASFLPSWVVHVSKIFPSYWYISNNDLITKLETINFTSLNPILLNLVVLICYAILFIVLTVMYNKMHLKDN